MNAMDDYKRKSGRMFPTCSEILEVIRGLATDQETYDAAVDIVERVGKHVTNAEDFPAFIVNRILLPMINEAVYTLYEGVGNVDSIDTARGPSPPSSTADGAVRGWAAAGTAIAEERRAAAVTPAATREAPVRRRMAMRAATEGITRSMLTGAPVALAGCN